MPDPDAPPRADRPEAVLPLVHEALTAGDVDAAAALYAPGALLHAWGRRLQGAALHGMLASLADLRAPIRLERAEVASPAAGDLGRAVVAAHWHVDAAVLGAGCPIDVAVDVVAVVAVSAERGWQVVEETWTTAAGDALSVTDPSPPP